MDVVTKMFNIAKTLYYGLSNCVFCYPYLNVDRDNDYPVATTSLSARNTNTVAVVSDPIHVTTIGFQKVADTIYNEW